VYRKTAWTLEELTESVAEIYIKQGREGLEKSTYVGKSLGEDIEHELQEFSKDEEHMF
jgi:hypothetical protein